MSNTAERINIQDLMQQIRNQVKEQIDSDSYSLPAFSPQQVDFLKEDEYKAGDLTNCENLLFLNRNYGVSLALNPGNIVSHRAGIIGKLIVFVKRKVAVLLRESILKDYLAAEQEFLTHLVRHLNFNSRYTDSRDFSLFWQLIRKIDTDVEKSLERVERIYSEIQGSLSSLQKHCDRSVSNLSDSVNKTLNGLLPVQHQMAAELATLQNIVRGMEGILTTFSLKPSGYASINAADLPDLSYLLLENRFRGSEEEIAERQKIYVEYFKPATKPVLDVGCGRGEMLVALRDSGIAAKGIDLDPAMVTVCKSKGLDVSHSDLISYLKSTEDGSLGGLIALQVVEHLPREILLDFIRLARQKVTAGGLVIFETINPTSMSALSSNYFRDPTHVFPQHPDTLGFVMSSNALELVETRFLSPVPESAQLKPLKSELYMTPKWNEMIELFNHNVSLLNSLLFGYQDYCVVGKVPG